MSVLEASPYDRLGGADGVRSLSESFYRRVLSDPALVPLFADPTEDHAGRMALFLAEFLGGPTDHTRLRGGPTTMFRVHMGLRITEVQRSKWVAHMTAVLDEMVVPADLRTALLGYFEQGSQLARQTSQQPRPGRP